MARGLCLAGGIALGAYLTLAPRSASPAWCAIAAFLHGLLLVMGIWPLVARSRPALVVLALSGILGLLSAAYLGRRGAAPWLQTAHLVTGLAAVVLALRPTRPGAGWVTPTGVACLAGGLLITLLHLASREHRSAWRPPTYDPVRSFQFLTATTADQANLPAFPAALQASGSVACMEGCHVSVREQWSHSAHATTGSSVTFRALRADFARRRGEESARWCDGCHRPAAGVGGWGLGVGGGSHAAVGCGVCHGATDVTALYGSAALRLDAGASSKEQGMEARFWPASHARRYFQPELLRAPEMCASCHRKGFNLPQNQYRWMPGPDDYGEWQASRWSGRNLFAPGAPVGQKDCLGCHPAHTPSKPTTDALALDAFLRPAGVPGATAVPLERGLDSRPGQRVQLDVVVENRGIGHAFPTRMPDQQESWLEVRVQDRQGRPVLQSGVVQDGASLGEAHAYRLVARDREGKPVLHGDLDRMTSVSEWRRILPGAADLARYELTVPEGGIGKVEVRLLRRRRPEFARWVAAGREGKEGERERGREGEADVLASSLFPAIRAGSKGLESDGERLRRYGSALAGVKDYPRAVQALLATPAGEGGTVESRLALGKVYLDQGDLLAALEQFQRAGSAAGQGNAQADRARAWEGSVQRRMGQPDRAVSLLEPLRKGHPRDRQLLYELGHTYLALLRNREAVAAFRAMLDVDPLDASAHFGLMVSQQRLNLLTEARREETLYRLLSPPEARSQAVEAQPLHVHQLMPHVRALGAER